MYKKVIVRKTHSCAACNGDIRKGEEAIVGTDWIEGAFQRYPVTHYFHSDGRNANSIRSMSFNQIRAEICSKRRGYYDGD